MDYVYQESTKPDSHLEYFVDRETNSTVWVKQQAFSFMDQLEGWCSKQKAGILMDLILKQKPQTILEIGVFGGKSLVPMACALKTNGTGKIYGIDPWDSQASVEGIMVEESKKWWAKLDHTAILSGLISKIRQFDLEDQIVLLKCTSADAPAITGIDMLHVDGNHSDATSYLDVTKWVPQMNSGGWIIFDDMTWFENGVYTTARAVEWLDQNCLKFAEFTDGCVWGVWIKP